MADATFEGWALVEQMGHKRIAGYVREVQLAGVSMLRIDVPGPGAEPMATQFIHASSLYAMTPMAEDAVRRMVSGMRVDAPAAWGTTRQLPSGDDFDPDFDSDDEEESDDDVLRRIVAEGGLVGVLGKLHAQYCEDVFGDPTDDARARILDRAIGELKALQS